MKKKFIIFAIISVICLLSLTVYAADFTDINGHWAENYINRWSEEKVINGYEDNTFKPNNNITRAEFVAMIMRIFAPEKKADISRYIDINSSAWYYDTLSRGYAMGAIQGYEDNTMRPDANITRQEAMVILNRILLLTPSESNHTFIDANEIASWAKESVTAFVSNGYINGYEDGTIRPTAYITRAEITKILDQSISKIITQSGEYDFNGMTGSVVVKVENVLLKNENMIQKVFALNEQVKNSLTTLHEIKVINANGDNIPNEGITPDNNGQNGSDVVSKEEKYMITLKTNGKVYDVIKEGKLVDGAKVSIIVDGKTILDAKEFSKQNFFQFKLDLLTALKNNAKKNINKDRLARTLEANSNASSEDLSKTLIQLLSEENQAMIEALLSENEDKSLSEIYKSMSEDELMDLAMMILDIDYDKIKELLENL